MSPRNHCFKHKSSQLRQRCYCFSVWYTWEGANPKSSCSHKGNHLPRP